MSEYGRASDIPGPNGKLFGGVGDTKGSGSGTDRQGGAVVRMTGQGGVGDGEAGPDVRVEGSGPEGRDSKSSRSEVSDGDVDEFVGAGLAVEVGWGFLYSKLST